MNNITFDLETLGNTALAPIVQIGAVKFDDKGDILDTFLRNIKLESLQRYEFRIDWSTIKFWMEQKDEAIKSVFVAEPRIDIRQALREFQQWVEKPSEYYYWSHATFDPPILNNNLLTVGLEVFIPYRLHRDIRTLTHFTSILDIEREGIYHNALDDSIYQSKYISSGLKTLKQ